MNIREEALKYLTDDKVKHIKLLWNSGKPTYEVAKEMDIPEYYVIVALGRG